MGFFRSVAVGFLVAAIGAMPSLAAKKVVVIDSYHEGYEWSDGLVGGAVKVLKTGGYDYKVIRMDTKRNPSEDFKKSASLKAKAEIEAYAPDAIIAGDDNANKYLIVPYFKDGKIPVLFAGINWDASAYGFPCSNVTGMLEVAPFPAVQANMKVFAKGDKIGFIGVDNETSKKEAINTEKVYGVTMEKKYCKTFAEWKDAFSQMQTTVNWLYLENYAGITDWDSTAAEAYAMANTKIPSVTIYDWMTPMTLMGVVKSPEEQGEWAANAAVKVLTGTAIASIPVDKNKRGIIMLNQKMAAKLGVTFDINLVKQAKKIIK